MTPATPLASVLPGRPDHRGALFAGPDAGTRDLPHLGGLVFGTPLMIARPKLDTILQVLALRPAGEPSAPGLPEGERQLVVTPNGIAIIPVLGTLANRTFGLAALSGLASYLRLGEQLDLAAADPAVKGILLDVDSNGGQAGGVFDLAERVLALRGIKPVYAIADEAALSAAYALACGAERLYVTQTGAVGSIGVVAVHVDQSAADQQAGLRYDYVTAGEHKADGHPHAPLTDGARTALQAEVDRLYGLFAAHVAKARALPETVVRDQQAGVYFGANAVDAGLADQVGTLATVLNDLSARIAPRRTAGRGGSLPLTVQKGSIPMPEALPAETAAVTEASLREQLAAEIAAEAGTTAAEDPRVLTLRLRAEAAEILELCRIAGQPGLAAGFIRQGLTPAAVRKALLTGRAEQFEAALTTPLNPAAAVGENPLIAAIKATHHRKGA